VSGQVAAMVSGSSTGTRSRSASRRAGTRIGKPCAGVRQEGEKLGVQGEGKHPVVHAMT
jgi:hypothetical protein